MWRQAASATRLSSTWSSSRSPPENGISKSLNMITLKIRDFLLLLGVYSGTPAALVLFRILTSRMRTHTTCQASTTPSAGEGREGSVRYVLLLGILEWVMFQVRCRQHQPHHGQSCQDFQILFAVQKNCGTSGANDFIEIKEPENLLLMMFSKLVMETGSVGDGLE